MLQSSFAIMGDWSSWRQNGTCYLTGSNCWNGTQGFTVVCRATRLDSPLGFGHSPLCVLFVVTAWIFRSSDVLGDRRAWRQSGNCSLKSAVGWKVVLEQHTCRQNPYWLAGEAEEGGRMGWGFWPLMESLESGVPRCVVGN